MILNKNIKNNNNNMWHNSTFYLPVDFLINKNTRKQLTTIQPTGILYKPYHTRCDLAIGATNKQTTT